MLEKSKIQAGFQRVLIAVVCILSFAVLFSIMAFSKPTDIGPGGVTLWFVLALLALTSLFMLITLARLQRKLGPEAKGTLLRAFRSSVVFAGGLVILLAMSSLGTLGLNDVLLLVGAVVVIEFYFYSSGGRSA